MKPSYMNMTESTKLKQKKNEISVEVPQNFKYVQQIHLNRLLFTADRTRSVIQKNSTR